MSKTLFVEFRGRGFCAFDVVSGIFLKHLVEVASTRIAGENAPWLAEAIEHWRFNAVISDYGLFLDDDRSAEQVRSVLELARVSCNLLSKPLFPGASVTRPNLQPPSMSIQQI